MLSSLESPRPPVEAVKAITVPCNETILEATIQMVLHLAQFSSNSSFVYSWSIGHILEHEFFCLGRLGSHGKKEKKVDLRNSDQLLRVVFSTFGGQNKHFQKFQNYFRVRTKKLHKIKVKKIFFDTWKKNNEF